MIQSQQKTLKQIFQKWSPRPSYYENLNHFTKQSVRMGPEEIQYRRQRGMLVEDEDLWQEEREYQKYIKAKKHYTTPSTTHFDKLSTGYHEPNLLARKTDHMPSKSSGAHLLNNIYHERYHENKALWHY